MIAFLAVIYAAVITWVFKIMRIAPTAYLVATAILAGVAIVGAVAAVWSQGAPLSEKIVTTQYVVELVSHVNGRVATVDAQAYRPLRKGDLLLQVDPTEYQYKVAQLEAQLKAAQAAVRQAEAGLPAANAAIDSAQANAAKAKSADELAKTQEEMSLGVQRANAGAISVLKVAESTQNRESADAALDQAQAAVAQAQAAALQAGVAVEVARSNVPAVEAQLNDARFDLAQCKMTAPDDGYVVNWQVQVGTMLTAGGVGGTFVKTSDIAVLATYPQNFLANVQPGDDVEMVLNPYPGAIFDGKVAYLIPASGGGQLKTSATIPSAADIGSSGLNVVRINFSDEAVARTLSLGSGGSAVIFTHAGKPTHMISKVVIRMKKWLLYVLPSA
jgi:membrane fusion protein, multidrug efflux system